MAEGEMQNKKARTRVQALEFWLPDLDSNQGPAD